MPIAVTAEMEILVGSTFILEGRSTDSPFACVFEDDGETGYFYAVDVGGPNLQILDAVHIYNVQGVLDRANPSVATIGWSVDGLKSVLLINGYPHAIFDFVAKRGYCRSGFPPPWSGWSGHEWDNEAENLFAE
ncbi:MAG TPA: DUF2251 domain-containing protein [Caulifigura sp.]|nr:DUF2251 domain-containing protein [Caulifigura sp.]